MRRPVPGVLRYALAAAVFVLLVWVSRATRAVFGFSVDTTSLIILAMIGSAWYLGRGPGLTIAVLFEGMLDYYAGWPPKDPARFAMIAFNRILLFGSVVWFASARRAAELALRDKHAALETALAGERQARTEAESANRLKDEFLATVSHELRTPLNTLLGWSAMLNRHDVDPSTLRQAAAAIERSARAQTHIVEDLLDTSRLMTRHLRIDKQPVDLSSVVAEAIEMVRGAAAARDIEIDEALEPRAIVDGDEGRLRQIAWNLLGNAIKFSRTGGAVRVSVTHDAGAAQLRVSDDGIGIDPEFMPNVFARFRQEDASMTREHGGLGLGLSIVQQLVELHGGGVTVESEGRGKGATFVVRLPAPAGEPNGAVAYNPRPEAV